MWSFNILKVLKTGPETVEVVVEFTKGQITFTRRLFVDRNNFNRSWLEGQIKREVKIFEDAKKFVTDIKEGTFTITDSTPTQEELDKSTFVNLVIKLAKVQKLVDLGLLDASEIDPIKTELLTMDIPSLIDSTPIY